MESQWDFKSLTSRLDSQGEGKGEGEEDELADDHGHEKSQKAPVLEWPCESTLSFIIWLLITGSLYGLSSRGCD